MRQAMGTVYGDIGTSVLYTTMEITRETILLKNASSAEASLLVAAGGDLVTRNEALGGLSLVFWALVYLTVKYDLMIMRADHRGEGGEFALWSLLKGYTGRVFGFTFLTFLVVCAGGMLAADGVITPPISMLGAFEPLGETWSVIATLACLWVLFKVQYRGTSKVGGLFGWFMICIWFPWIALKGIEWVFRSPEVFLAVNPYYAIQFLMQFPWIGGLVILGLVVLAITGGEAKYADIGHFSTSHNQPIAEGRSIEPRCSGRVPVMMSWFTIVLPCLLLCYAAQVGYILNQGVPPRAATFYAITHQFGVESVDHIILIIDLIIAAIAAFIASQAVITGLFSIMKQAIAQGFMPRCRVFYTSVEGEGQVYLPAVNWALFLGCIVVVLAFRSAGNLAAAYGIAVTATMGITTIMFGSVAYYRWKWTKLKVAFILTPILAIDLVFFGSNLLKLASGGYFPILIASALIIIMTQWRWGRAMLGKAFYEFGVREGKKIEWLIALRDMLDDIELSIKENLPSARMLVQGRRRLVENDRAAVFLVSRPIQTKEDYVPVVLRVFLKKYGVLPSYVVFLHVNVESIAFVKRKDRFTVLKLANDIDSVAVNYGYMEQPDVRKALRELQMQGRIHIAADRWIIEVGEEDIIVAPELPWYKRFRIGLFSWILRLSTPAHKYLGLNYDAAVSKEVIPVVFDATGARIALPELEIVSTQK